MASITRQWIKPRQTFQAAIADAEFDGMWKVYLSNSGFNSMFLFCDVIPIKGIAAEAGVDDLAALQKQLMAEVSEAALNLGRVCASICCSFMAPALRQGVCGGGRSPEVPEAHINTMMSRSHSLLRFSRRVRLDRARQNRECLTAAVTVV